MQYKDRLERITRRARLVYRVRHAVEITIRVAIVAAAAAFLVLLLQGLGFLSAGVWQIVAPLAGAACLAGAVTGALLPIDDGRVLARMDRDYRLGNGLSTAREFLTAGIGSAAPMVQAHIRQSLERAEGLVFARAVTANLGVHARILGILCVCIVSLAFI